MKWILSHASDDIHQWQLENEKGLAYVSFSRQWLSLRFTGSIKRLLFLRVQGLLQKKVLLQTEYGITLGETALTEKLTAGQLVLNEQKLFYEINDDQMALYDAEKQLLASCSLQPSALTDKLERYGLLFSFAWFVAPGLLAERRELLSATG